MSQIHADNPFQINLQNNPTTLGISYNSYNQNEIYMPREFELPQLNLKICSTIEHVYYTGIPIPVKVALIDPLTGDVVKYSEAIEVEIDALVKEFHGKIVPGKDGRCLLKDSSRRVLLKEGVGFIEVSFKHSKTWFRRCSYRFGARVIGQYDGTRIKEAKTECFWVQDRRGMSKRCKPLQLSAKIWEIKGIGRNGGLAKLLIKRKIVTVKEFLVEYNLHLDRLKQIFEEAKFSNKWETICEHALSCQIDERRYLYSCPELRETSVVFNTVAELLGMMLRGDQFVSVEEISEDDKACGRELVMLAFQNWKNVEPYLEKKQKQQAGGVNKTFHSRDRSESSCSCAVKRLRTPEREMTVSTQNDPVAERAITDDSFGGDDMNDPKIESLLFDDTSVDYFPDLPDVFPNGTYYKDVIHDQSWFPPSEVESLFQSNTNLINGQIHTGDECFVWHNCLPETSDPETSTDADVYSLWQ